MSKLKEKTEEMAVRQSGKPGSLKWCKELVEQQVLPLVSRPITLIKLIRSTWWDAFGEGRLYEMKHRTDEIVAYIERRMRERREWAASEDGRKILGPGSPTIPGLEEYDRILRFVRDYDEREWNR